VGIDSGFIAHGVSFDTGYRCDYTDITPIVQKFPSTR
jgi:hypothetical protein